MQNLISEEWGEGEKNKKNHIKTKANQQHGNRMLFTYNGESEYPI